MTENHLARRTANFIRKYPFFIRVAHFGYRLLQPKFSVGVIGVVFNDQGKVLLVEHVFHPHYPWGLPGGWIDANERPPETAQRELLEELSLKVEIKQLLLSEITFKNHIDFAFLCTTQDQPGKLSGELLRYGWFDPHDTPPLTAFHRRAIDQALGVL